MLLGLTMLAGVVGGAYALFGLVAWWLDGVFPRKLMSTSLMLLGIALLLGILHVITT